MKNEKVPESISWKAHAFKTQVRSSAWYLGLAAVTIGLIAFALYNQSIIMLITFAMIALVIFILSLQPSSQTTYKVTKTGIYSGNIFYPYKVIRKFWILYNPPEVKTLNFETSAYVNNKISMQLGNQDPVELKLVLRQYLIEDLDREESVTEVLARKLKI